MKVARINEKKITTYTLNTGKTRKKDIEKTNFVLPEDNHVKGYLSDKARGRMKKCLTMIVEVYSHRKKIAKRKGEKYKEELTFITLTLSAQQKHNDYHIRRNMLIPFLDYLRESQGVTTHIWRAEPQENGNIHFHILANKNIAWRIIRTKWNRLQKKEGYIADYKAKFSCMSEDEYIRHRGAEEEETVKSARKAYKYGIASNWEDPNSTDIHQTGKLRNTMAYMAKYMSKPSTEGQRTIEGHLWGKCEKIEKMEMLELELDSALEYYISRIKENKDNFIVEDVHFSFYWLKNEDYNNFPKKIRELYIAQQEYNYSVIC